MRRYRRMVLIDRFIPFLAALVGLVALAGAVLVQLNTNNQGATLRAQMAEIQATAELLTQRNAALNRQVEAMDGPGDDGTAEALLALQDRMVKLEDAVKTAPLVAPAPLSPDGEGSTPAAAAKPIDPNLPTTDCIPLDTRFMATPGDSFPICQSKVVIKAASITSDMVILDDGTSIVETGFSPIPGSNCTAMVFSADVEGFAEMRVNCQ